eukprot:7322494-Alexandrium_andersonii.AAC.1
MADEMDLAANAADAIPIGEGWTCQSWVSAHGRAPGARSASTDAERWIVPARVRGRMRARGHAHP